MRITTKMMQSRSLYNLNTNKTLQEKLTTQMSTQKKITRPSDDPVIAIRSLKLNSTLNQIKQYSDKNAKDAESWLTLTESAISTTADIMTGMRKYIEQAAQGSLEATDRADILKTLSNYRTEIYSTGNADSDGRSIFTGYRTNTALTFQEDQTVKYEITEQRTNSCLDVMTFVQTGDLSTINSGNYETKNTTEYDVDSYQVARIRTAYSNLDFDEAATGAQDPAKVSISFFVDTKLTAQNDKQGVTINTTSYAIFAETEMTNPNELNLQVEGTTYNMNITGTDTLIIAKDGTVTRGSVTGGNFAPDAEAGDTIIYFEDGKMMIKEYSSLREKTPGVPLEYKTTSLGFEADPDTNWVTYDKRYETNLTVTDIENTKIKDINNGTEKRGVYLDAVGEQNADNIIYVAETGEILLGSNIQAQLAGLSLDSEIRFTYEKSSWNNGDLNPIHYFNCKKYDDADPNLSNYEPADTYIEYNKEMLTETGSDLANQIISYDIGNNQTIRVNTVASEVFTHDVGRDVDEVITMLGEYSTLEETYKVVKDMIDSGTYEDENLTKLEQQLAALDKARTMAKDKVQKTCEGMLTTFDGYLKQTTLAYTDVGSRSSRLKLIQNRLSAQETNFDQLVSENENADVTDLAIQLKSVELTYEAALSSIGYVMKTSLLNFI